MPRWDTPWRESKLQRSGIKGRCVPVEVSHSRGSLKVARGTASMTSGGLQNIARR